ncbi:hypothetical protein B0H17DRAFT_1084332 [Mycena rosella]|uniref:DUF7330 domain-containing protein n=1 Tax=Mycena rosella TaxID=1033263 RepID=A0AAD7GAC7_MYCRO|nr:hypothetical protein B0H17DRAFT_1084332 [Mycena rosella]
MITPHNAPKSPPKASTPLLNGGAAAPPYAPTTYAVYPSPYAQKRVGQGQSAVRRMCLAILAAVGLWFLASALLGSGNIFGGSRFNSDRTDDYPLPPDVDLEDCVGWGDTEKSSPAVGYPYSAQVSLDVSLPSETETLLFLSKGALSAGNLKITTSSELTDARVDITAHYHTTAVRDAAKVCFITRKEGESGVGIFTPAHWWSRKRTDRLYFDVELLLPRGSASSSPLYINGLTTDVNNFSHDLDNLKDIIDFGNIFLGGSNGKIHAKALGAATATLQTSNGGVSVEHLVALKAGVQTSNGLVSIDYLVAQNAAVRSSNARIHGNYHVSDSLSLITSNGAIQASVNINGSETSNSLIMHTTNSHIDAVVDLDTTSGTGGIFLVKAETSNGRLTTRIASAPLDAVLTLNARTSNTQASVELPATYEGSLALSTSSTASAAIRRVDSHEQDPACAPHADCKGRTRAVETHVVRKGGVEGAVYWEKKNARRGSVTLQSSNGAVTIYV